jgi:plastocyanin
MRRRGVARWSTALILLLYAHAGAVNAAGGASVKGTVSLPAESGAPSDVVISLEGSLGTPAPTKAVIDQKEMTFVPHVVAVAAGGSVEFLNSDPVMHNVFSSAAAKRFDLGMFGKGETRTVVFEKPGVVELRCNVHPKMRAFVVVLSNNYFAIPDARGNFQIAGVPAGRYQLRAWHESLPAVETWVNLDDGTVQSVDVRFKK